MASDHNAAITLEINKKELKYLCLEIKNYNSKYYLGVKLE